MSGDLLSAAADALRRASTEAVSDGGEQTLARLLRTVRRRQRRRWWVRTVVLQLILVTVALGTWAATSGRLSAVLRGNWGRSFSRHASPSAKPVPAPAVPALPIIVPIAVPVAVPVTPERAAAAASSPSAIPVATHPARAVATARPPGARIHARGDQVPVAPDQIYLQAHEAHFARGDFSAALALWDLYLASEPLPRLAVEARYNRAIALARVGRNREAADQLRPFADGDYGSYRRSEARRLLDALGSGGNGRR
jgi:hypothetical protein